MKEPDFNYYDDDRTIIAHVYYKDRTFSGEAFCADEDEPFKNRRVGETIALYRAQIYYLRYVRDYELAPACAAIKDVYYSMSHSKNFNEHSFEARRIRRKMYQYEADLLYIRNSIRETYNTLQAYIKTRDRINKKMDNKG